MSTNDAHGAAEWASTAEATLALRISRNKLFEMESTGELSPGRHFYKATQRRLLWNPAAIRQTLIERAAAPRPKPETYSDLPAREVA